jgi:hypothetical protein
MSSIAALLREGRVLTLTSWPNDPEGDCQSVVVTTSFAEVIGAAAVGTTAPWSGNVALERSSGLGVKRVRRALAPPTAPGAAGSLPCGTAGECARCRRGVGSVIVSVSVSILYILIFFVVGVVSIRLDIVVVFIVFLRLRSVSVIASTDGTAHGPATSHSLLLVTSAIGKVGVASWHSWAADTLPLPPFPDLVATLESAVGRFVILGCGGVVVE